ncbi:MAG: hypothetical protein HQ578_07920 [Chloroflexi bacterium]|nr:hypothetical protein [Chloroflexota bacterium]
MASHIAEHSLPLVSLRATGNAVKDVSLPGVHTERRWKLQQGGRDGEIQSPALAPQQV